MDIAMSMAKDAQIVARNGRSFRMMFCCRSSEFQQVQVIPEPGKPLAMAILLKWKWSLVF
jgi:hypothetical protein